MGQQKSVPSQSPLGLMCKLWDAHVLPICHGMEKKHMIELCTETWVSFVSESVSWPLRGSFEQGPLNLVRDRIGDRHPTQKAYFILWEEGAKKYNPPVVHPAGDRSVTGNFPPPSHFGQRDGPHPLHPPPRPRAQAPNPPRPPPPQSLAASAAPSASPKPVLSTEAGTAKEKPAPVEQKREDGEKKQAECCSNGKPSDAPEEPRKCNLQERESKNIKNPSLPGSEKGSPLPDSTADAQGGSPDTSSRILNRVSLLELDLKDLGDMQGMFGTDPQKVINRLERFFDSYNPNYAFCEQLLNRVLTRTERGQLWQAERRWAAKGFGRLRWDQRRDAVGVQDPQTDNRQSDLVTCRERLLTHLRQMAQKPLAFDKFKALKQGRNETPSEFWCRFTEKAKEYTRWDPERDEDRICLLCSFATQLQESIRCRFYESQPCFYACPIDQVLKTADSLWEKEEEKRTQREKEKEFKMMARALKQVLEGPGGQRMITSGGNGGRGRGRGCFQCGQIGHFKRDCPWLGMEREVSFQVATWKTAHSYSRYPIGNFSRPQDPDSIQW